jgi:isochorismate synthase
MNDRLRDPSLLAPQATDLLRLYRPGANLFASPHRSVLTQGRHAVLTTAASSTLCTQAHALLQQVKAEGHVRPLLIGAVPFQPDAPARLSVPEGVVWGLGVEGLGALASSPPPPRLVGKVSFAPTPDDYQAHVTHALAQMQVGTLDKVVLSRSLTIEAQIDVARLMRRLAASNTRGYTFAIDLPGSHDGHRALVGASPELLVARHGQGVTSHPLAGSIPRSPDMAEDQRRAQGLLRSAKDHREHAMVVDQVARALRPLCGKLHVPEQPSLVSTTTMWHLGTEITGTVIDPSVTSLQLALALHPTPAVCGQPTQAARDFINQVEGFDRGLFTGLVGWCDGDGDGEWAVTIRCAEVGPRGATLYAGAGIVAGSQPASELAETSAKLRTMLRAMELESLLGDAT